jgi:hypothetical protein
MAESLAFLRTMSDRYFGWRNICVEHFSGSCVKNEMTTFGQDLKYAFPPAARA